MDEFKCIECGTHIIRFIEISDLNLCAACLFSPGWFKDPELCKVLDPMNFRDPPPHEVEE